MIAAITTVLDEAHIVGSTVAHLYNQGIDEIYVYLGPCTDNTREVLAPYPVTILDDLSPVHYQPARMNELAALAGEAGAEWIIPFDADEYWCSEKLEAYPTVADALGVIPADGTVVRVGSYHYHDREYRQPHTQWNTKVAYRWRPEAELTNGNHDVLHVGGLPVYGALLIRELQYSSFEHFCKKVADRCRTLDPAARARGEGVHHTRLEGASVDELREAWDKLAASANVYDPIP